jgi:large subunit ribosomal protein L6
MSRIGKLPVAVPQGVKASVQAGAVVIEGPKGRLSYSPAKGISVVVEAGHVIVSAGDNLENAQLKADFGTTRARINNMVKGVSTGWKRTLELNGVGFTAKLAGQSLTLAVGFSHDVVVQVPKELKCNIVKNVIELEGADRELIGQLAATIRKVQPPEPYLGKGIKYAEEKIRRKAGKTGKKA